MKGYLQRLAASVNTPGESIHPVVGSLFSAPPYGTEAAVPGLEQDVPAAVGTQPREVSGLDGPSVAPKRSPTHSMAVPHDHSARPSGAPPHTGSAPFAGPRPASPPDQPATHAGRDAQRDDRSAADHTDPAQQLAEGFAGSPDQRHIAGQPPPGAQPESRLLMPEHNLASPVRGGAPHPDSPWTAGTRPLYPPASQPGRETGVGPSGALKVTPAEPDEIHIHIGRIEVTAVQPAPARTAVATPRTRAPSLSDYLRRRDGRLP